MSLMTYDGYDLHSCKSEELASLVFALARANVVVYPKTAYTVTPDQAVALAQELFPFTEGIIAVDTAEGGSGQIACGVVHNESWGVCKFDLFEPGKYYLFIRSGRYGADGSYEEMYQECLYRCEKLGYEYREI